MKEKCFGIGDSNVYKLYIIYNIYDVCLYTHTMEYY